MKLTRRMLLAAGAGSLATAGASQASSERRSGVLRIPDFPFGTGERRPVRLAYTVAGTPRLSPSGVVGNGVLLLHGTGGRGIDLLSPAFHAAFFAPGRPLDLSRTFIVVPDALGHGGSSRPSTDPELPVYGYRDMVLGQRRVAEHLGVRAPRLIFGTSMGGHHAWVWATEHPGVAGRHLAVATAPARFTGRNLLWRELAAAALRKDPAPGGGGARQAAGVMLQAMASPAALERVLQQPATLARFLEGAVAQATLTPLDLAAAIEAYRDYDPWPRLPAVVSPMLNLNFADDPLYPPETDVVAAAARLQPLVRQVVVAAGPETSGHGTIRTPSLWTPLVSSFIADALR